MYIIYILFLFFSQFKLRQLTMEKYGLVLQRYVLILVNLY